MTSVKYIIDTAALARKQSCLLRSRSLGSSNSQPRCGVYAGANVDAGNLVVQTSTTAPLPVQPVASAVGEHIYTQALPAGSMQPGMLSAVGQGGPTVGPFNSALVLPTPIQFDTDLSPGTVIDSTQTFRLSWTNGRAGDLVNVRLLSAIPLGGTDIIHSGLEYYALAEEGSVALEDRGAASRPAISATDSDRPVHRDRPPTAGHSGDLRRGRLDAGRRKSMDLRVPLSGTKPAVRQLRVSISRSGSQNRD